MRFLKLVMSDYKVVVFLFIAVPFVIVTYIIREGQNDEFNNIVLSIYSSIILIAVTAGLGIISKYIKYIKLEGRYHPFSYQDDGKNSFKLKNEKNGIAILTYRGGNEFIIRLEESEKLGVQNIWEGQMTFNNINIADVAWSYISPPELANACGLKKAVIINSIPPKIFLSSPDGQGYGREVLIKIN